MVFKFIEYGGLSHVTLLVMVSWSFFLSLLLISFTDVYVTSSLNSLFLRTYLSMGIDLLNIDCFQDIFEIFKLTDNAICGSMFRSWFELLIQTGCSFGFQ